MNRDGRSRSQGPAYTGKNRSRVYLTAVSTAVLPSFRSGLMMPELRLNRGLSTTFQCNLEKKTIEADMQTIALYRSSFFVFHFLLLARTNLNILPRPIIIMFNIYIIFMICLVHWLKMWHETNAAVLKCISTGQFVNLPICRFSGQIKYYKVKRFYVMALCRFLLADFILLFYSRLSERKENSSEWHFCRSLLIKHNVVPVNYKLCSTVD